MHPSFTLLFSALSAGSLFLASFLLLTGAAKANREANKWLGVFFFLLSLVFMQVLLEQTDNSSVLIVQLTEWPRWAIFPCLYISVFKFVHPRQRPQLLFIHFLPAMVFVVLMMLGGDVQLPTWGGLVARYFFSAQGLVYGFLNLQILTKHKGRIRQLLADKVSDLNWLRHFVYAPLIIAGLWFAFRHLPEFEGWLQLLCLVVCLYFVSAAFRQREVYPEQILKVVDELIDRPKTSTTAKRLTRQQIELLKDRVELIVCEQKPYLDPSLNLQTLADKVGMNTHELSLVLNEGFGMNFYAYVNNLRAEEAVKLLESKRYGRGDMEAIAIRSGFNSRTTFYASIKKLKGKTPVSLLK